MPQNSTSRSRAMTSGIVRQAAAAMSAGDGRPVRAPGSMRGIIACRGRRRSARPAITGGSAITTADGAADDQDAPQPSTRSSKLRSQAERARSFGAWADDYDRYRPDYPAELFEMIQARLGLPDTPDVADLGAGTGRASIAMARRGWRVTAIEPDEHMRWALRDRLPATGLRIATVTAGAEATTMPDASVDLVTAAQAFHWFDHVRAVPEMARISRARGGAAVFWNVRDESRSGFLAAYAALLQRHLPGDPLESGMLADRSDSPGLLAAGGWFDVDDRIELQHERQMSPNDFIGLAYTASYVRAELHGAAEVRFRTELRELVDEHARDRRLEVPYRLDLLLGHRTSKPAPDSPTKSAPEN